MMAMAVMATGFGLSSIVIWLGAVLAYLHAPRRLWLVCALFAAACLAKATAVTLPGMCSLASARERSTESLVANSKVNVAVVFVHSKTQKHVVLLFEE